MRINLKNKILFAFIFISIFSITIITLLFINQNKSYIIKSIQNNFSLISESLYYSISNKVTNSFTRLELVSNDSIIKNPNYTKEEKINQLNIYKNLFLDYEDITIIDTNGITIVSTDYKYRGDWNYLKNFQESLKGNSYLSRVKIIPYPQTYVMFYSTPIIYKNEIIAVLLFQMNMRQIWQITDDLHIGNNGFIIIKNSFGKIIFSPNKAEILENFNKNYIIKNNYHLYYNDNEYIYNNFKKTNFSLHDINWNIYSSTK